MCVVFGYLQTWKKDLFSLSILTCFGRICICIVYTVYVLYCVMTFLSCYIILSYWAHLCCKWLFCCMYYNLQSQLSWPNVQIVYKYYITFIHVVLTTNNIDVVMVLSTTNECLLLLFSRNHFMFVENMIFFTETKVSRI